MYYIPFAWLNRVNPRRFSRSTVVVLSFFLVTGAVLYAYQQVLAFSGLGDGSPESPYIITSCTQLQEIEQDLTAHYKLDPEEGYINCSDSQTWNEGAGFDPIGDNSAGNDASRFTGSLDGNKTVIYNLYISDTSGSVDGVGLFGTIGTTGEVFDLGLVGGQVSANGGRVAPLAGQNYGSISHSFADVDVSSGNSFIGGLVGVNRGPISNSYANGDVIGGTYVGSFAGFTAASISDSYASGAVSGSGFEGGFVGRLFGGATLTNVLSASTVSGINKGGLVAALVSGSVVNGYWSSTLNPQDDCIIDEEGGISNVGCTDVSVTTTLLYDLESEPYVSFASGTVHLVEYLNRTPTFNWYDLEFLPGTLQGSGTSGDPNQITECLLIVDPGYYRLMNDITAPADENCIQIATSSVFIDGDDRTIFGSNETMSGVITVEGGPYENIHIHDVTVTDFLSGFSLFDVTSSTIERVESVSAGAYGIYVEQSTSTVITNSSVTSAFVNGIHVQPGNIGVTITDNTISESGIGNGIKVEWSDDISISGNTIFDIMGEGGDGIDAEGVSGLLVHNNNVSSTGQYGIEVSTYNLGEGWIENEDVTITSNTIAYTYDDSLNINYVTSSTIANNTVIGSGMEESGQDGIDVDDSVSVTIASNTITNVYEDGIEVEDGEDILITGNTVTGSYEGDGVNMYNTSSTTISINVITGTSCDGVYIEDTNNIVIIGNTFTDIGCDGVDLDEDGNGTDTVVISNNTFTDVDDNGIEVDESVNLTVTSNTFSNIGFDNSGSGMDITTASNLTVTSNTLSSIALFGILFQYSTDVVVENNTISEFGMNFDESDDEYAAGIYVDHSGNYSVENNQLDSTSEYAPRGVYVSGEYQGDQVYLYGANGNQPDWTAQSVDLSALVGSVVQLEILVYANPHEDDVSEFEGLYLDNLSVTTEDGVLFSDDVESGANGWTVDTQRGSSWSIVEPAFATSAMRVWYSGYDQTGQSTSLLRTLDLTNAETATFNFDTWFSLLSGGSYFEIFMSEILEEEVIERNVSRNTINVSGRALFVEDTSNVDILDNTFQSNYWVYTDNTESVVLSDEDSGNTYTFANGNGAWTVYDITDSNGDGWADEGTDLPFSVATLGDDLWVGEVVDEHPATPIEYTETRSSRRGGNARSNISRPTIPAAISATNGALRINNSADTTDSRTVTLSINAENATMMAISNSLDFSRSSYIPFSSTVSNHQLTAGNGTKSVYIKLRSNDGGTLTISDSITLIGQTVSQEEEDTESTQLEISENQIKPIVTITTPTTPIPVNGLQCSTNLVLTTPVRFGVANNAADVRLLEQFLNTYEGTNLPVNGIYETSDFNAVVKWQEKHASDILTPWGLNKGTGYVFTTSLKKIKEIHEKNCATVTKPVALTQPTTVVSASCLNTETTLTSGMNGPLVTTAQKLLQKLKFFTATPTGFYGPVTTASVRAFQTANGIDPLGIIGPVTRAKLNELGCR